MRQIRKLVRSRWARPALTLLLIIMSLILARLAGGSFDVSLGTGPWLDAGDHSTRVSNDFFLSDAFMLAAALIAGYPILMRAIQALRARMFSIDLLVTIASVGALVLGNIWEAAAVCFLFTVGNALEAATLDRTRAALTDLVSLAPVSATLLEEGETSVVPAEAVRPGQIVVVKNGEQVPVDGEVTSGHGYVDESAITGESFPASKVGGDSVFAGTVATNGYLHVQAREVGGQTALARIVRRVEDAQDAKARTQTFIEKFSSWYTPGIVVLSVLAGILTRDPALALTLLVIGCPGALVISIPVALVAGTGRGARSGVLIKGGEHLEIAARVDAVALDKTGTLTVGHPSLTDVISLHPQVDRRMILELAALAEAASEHPLARPVLDAAAAEGITVRVPDGAVTPMTGIGIAIEDGTRGRVAVGSRRLLDARRPANQERAEAAYADLAREGKTPMFVMHYDNVVGVIGVADEIRGDAADAVAALKRSGVKKIVMLTGDAEPVAQSVAEKVGVLDVKAGLLPDEKLAVIEELQADGYVVAMAGDGINDAPALAQANIGVAMGDGSAIAVETADIALLGGSLSKLPSALNLARRTVSVMRQNISIALLTVVALIIGVFAGGVTMSLGMLIHEASVLVVIVNAMRLLRNRRPGKHPVERDDTTAPERVLVASSTH